ncbi:hypothetical protein F7725_005577 [Dissostichus mawsoni]|uniref:Uncharacterized protein n=1 Tax=Dissostichus mawsoni TaxID=36200 RepID=A0A7J5YRM7_DISMA|nr:hypothetical protein F7725_005577 [Dissostichus mawsoni]
MKEKTNLAEARRTGRELSDLHGLIVIGVILVVRDELCFLSQQAVPVQLGEEPVLLHLKRSAWLVVRLIRPIFDKPKSSAIQTRSDPLTLDIFHDHAQMSPRLEGAEHGDDERVLGEGEDVSLHKRLLDLVPQDQILLVDLLHCKTLTCLSVAHQVDGTGEKEPGGTRYDDEELFAELDDEGELRTLRALISLIVKERQADRRQLRLLNTSTIPVPTHIIQQLLQVILQLTEVDAGDETLARFGQAVPGQLSYLVVDEAEDPIGQGQDALWREAVDELRQPLLHLSCGLNEYKMALKVF